MFRRDSVNTLHSLVKQSAWTGLEHLYHTKQAEALQVPQIPKTPKGSELKLTSGLGKKKPLYVAKKNTTSPYNPN